MNKTLENQKTSLTRSGKKFEKVKGFVVEKVNKEDIIKQISHETSMTVMNNIVDINDRILDLMILLSDVKVENIDELKDEARVRLNAYVESTLARLREAQKCQQ